MKTLAELFLSLITKSGIDPNSEPVKQLLSNAELSKVTIPENISGALENNLLTFDSAKANSAIKTHFYGQAYSGLDAELESAYNELGISDELKAKLSSEKSSTKRAALLAKEIQRIEKEQAASTTPADKKALQDQINKLNTEKAELVNIHKAELDKIKADSDHEVTDLLFRNSLAGYDIALGDLPAEVKNETVSNLIKTEMAKKGLKTVRENGVLKLVKEDGTDYFEANKKMEHKDFVGSVLAQNKLLKTTTASRQEGNTGAGGNNKEIQGNAGGQGIKPSTAMIQQVDALIDSIS